MSRYEEIYFEQGHRAVPKVDAIKNHGPEGILEDLARRYHYLGEHPASKEEPWGSRDHTYRKDGYILAWNNSLPYVSLTFDTEAEITEEHRKGITSKR